MQTIEQLALIAIAAVPIVVEVPVPYKTLLCQRREEHRGQDAIRQESKHSQAYRPAMVSVLTVHAYVLPPGPAGEHRVQHAGELLRPALQHRPP